MEKSSNRRFGVRTVAAIVAGLMVGGMCTAMTASAADDSAAGYSATAPVNLTRPATVPSMDGWTDGTGAWTLGEGTRVVSSDALAARAQSLASELTKFTDVDIKAATGSATGKDISLTLDASKKAELGDEGFKLNIGSKGLEVIGATDIGVFYGTRSVSQMLRQGQLTLPAGTVATKPKYKERGATLCACQIDPIPSAGETTIIGLPAIQIPITTTGDRPLTQEDIETIARLAPGTALLISTRGAVSGSRYLLDEDEVTVGRDSRADILLDDSTVSRSHAVFRRVGDTFVVYDSGSLNGTYVNRQRVDHQQLRNGDEIMIGKFRLVFFTKSAVIA